MRNSAVDDFFAMSVARRRWATGVKWRCDDVPPCLASIALFVLMDFPVSLIIVFPLTAAPLADSSRNWSKWTKPCDSATEKG